MASTVPAVVAYLEYRLPVAYDDDTAAVRWLQEDASGDPWVSARGDLARCFAMGSSAGGNMAFFAGVRTKDDPVRGPLLHQPYPNIILILCF
jgi:acetyl esterase/lipase